MVCADVLYRTTRRRTERAERPRACAAASVREVVDPSPVIAARTMISRRCASLQSGSAKVCCRSSRWSNSAGVRAGGPRSSATGTSRSSPELESRIRTRSPSNCSNRCKRPSHSTHSPSCSSKRSAESGSPEVVSVLRGFGHQMVVTDAFGQKLLVCLVHHRGGRESPRLQRQVYL